MINIDPQTIRGFTLGALDGLTTLIALVLGVYAFGVPDANLSLLAYGAAISGSLSMGINETFSMRIHNKYFQDEDSTNPYKVGAASFLAFLLGAALIIVPLYWTVYASIGIGALGFFLLGWQADAKKDPRSGLGALFFGALVCLISIGIGWLLGVTV